MKIILLVLAIALCEFKVFGDMSNESSSFSSVETSEPSGYPTEFVKSNSSFLCDPGFGYNHWSYSCEPCLPGSFSSGGTAGCELCRVNTYAELNSSSSCRKCPSGHSNDIEGSKTFSDCVLWTRNYLIGGAIGSIEVTLVFLLFTGVFLRYAFAKWNREVRKCVVLFGALNATLDFNDFISWSSKSSTFLGRLVPTFIFCGLELISVGVYCLRSIGNVVFINVILWRAYGPIGTSFQGFMAPFDSELISSVRHCKLNLDTILRSISRFFINFGARIANTRISFHSHCRSFNNNAQFCGILLTAIIVIILVDSNLSIFYSMGLYETQKKFKYIICSWSNWQPLRWVIFVVMTFVVQLCDPVYLSRWLLGLVYPPNINQMFDWTYSEKCNTVLPMDLYLTILGGLCIALGSPILIHLFSGLFSSHKVFSSKEIEQSEEVHHCSDPNAISATDDCLSSSDSTDSNDVPVIERFLHKVEDCILFCSVDSYLIAILSASTKMYLFGIVDYLVSENLASGNQHIALLRIKAATQFFDTQKWKRNILEEKHWNQYLVQCPTYLTVAEAAKTEMESDRSALSTFSVLLPFQLLTSSGRREWLSVAKTYVGIVLIPFGIWLSFMVERVRIIEKFEQFTKAECELLSGVNIFGSDNMNFGAYVWGDERFKRFLSAFVTSRIVLIQLLPQLTLLSLFCEATAASPLLVFDKDMNKFLPDLWCWDGFAQAKSLTGHCSIFVIPVGYFICVTQSRLFQFVSNCFLFSTAVMVYFRPSWLSWAVPIFLILTVHNGIAQSIINALRYSKFIRQNRTDFAEANNGNSTNGNETSVEDMELEERSFACSPQTSFPPLYN